MTTATMRITINDRGDVLQARLSERLDRAARLRCTEHGLAVIAIDISARENGWFDSRWTTCCEALERQGKAILKDRC